MKGQELADILTDFYIGISETGIELDTGTGQYWFAWNTVKKDKREHNLLG